MSIILNALNAKKKEEQKQEKIASTPEEGVYLGDNGLKKHRMPIMTTRAWILVGVAAVIGGIALVPQFYDKPVTKYPPPKVVQADALKKNAIKAARDSHTASSIEQADKLFNEGRFEESLQLYVTALQQDPNNAFLHNNVGLIFLKQELYLNSANHFKRAIEIDSKCAECFNNFGFLETLRSNFIEAEKYFRNAISLNKEYPDPYFNLGVLYEQSGDIQEAVISYQGFLQRFPDVNSRLFSDVKKHIHTIMEK